VPVIVVAGHLGVELWAKMEGVEGFLPVSGLASVKVMVVTALESTVLAVSTVSTRFPDDWVHAPVDLNWAAEAPATTSAAASAVLEFRKPESVMVLAAAMGWLGWNDTVMMLFVLVEVVDTAVEDSLTVADWKQSAPAPSTQVEKMVDVERMGALEEIVGLYACVASLLGFLSATVKTESAEDDTVWPEATVRINVPVDIVQAPDLPKMAPPVPDTCSGVAALFALHAVASAVCEPVRPVMVIIWPAEIAALGFTVNVIVFVAAVVVELSATVVVVQVNVPPSTALDKLCFETIPAASTVAGEVCIPVAGLVSASPVAEFAV
jgi:hypothetical protein